MLNFYNKINILIKVFLNKYVLRKPDFSEKNIFLKGQLLYEINKKKNNIQNFKEVEFSVFSQFGEDGIITWLVDLIPDIERTFVEIGTQDYWESNTRFLLKLHNWNGYLIEASSKDVSRIKLQRIFWQNKLKVINKFIDKENINELINKQIAQKNIGLLSLDIDGNDYWILDEIKNLNSDIVVCEYNPIFGDLQCITTIYDPNFVRSDKHYSNLYFGCSILALINLMKKKGYTFLGTNSKGMNAFFVKNEKLGFINDKIKDKKIFISSLREGRGENLKLNFKSMNENLKQIENMEVFDLQKKIKVKLSSFDKLYSDKWLNN